MKTLLKVVSVLCLFLVVTGCAPNAKEKKLSSFINEHLKKVEPLYKEAALASWKAATTGDEKYYKQSSELSFKIRKIYSNPEDFAQLKQLKESGDINNPVLARELAVLYNMYLENQIDATLLKQMVDLQTKIEQNFSTFRGRINGKEVTNNHILEILKDSTDSKQRKKAWLASKQVGAVLEKDIIKLVKLRNKAAKKLGFENYHTMALTLAEQDVEEISRLFDELGELTDEPFKKLKKEIDTVLAGNCGIDTAQLQPWHYHDPFFQETPMIYPLDLDTYYKGKKPKELAAKFYAGIGMPVESILANSDLYERKGKNPHAFCTDIDRQGDVRILCNIKDTETWMETTLHELGHAVYDKYHDPKVPYLLRTPAHIFTTEAIAMMFGRLSRNPNWMQQMLGLTDADRDRIAGTAEKYAVMKQLIFARWALVMFNFEKQMYVDPDQDLNELWWRMVRRYQYVHKPAGRNAPDWAAKAHFSIAPCYYHNYLLGELLASQLHHSIVTKVLKLSSDEKVSYVGKPEIGNYLRKNVFEPGAVYPWNEMIKRATGEYLTPKYFVEQFVK